MVYQKRGGHACAVLKWGRVVYYKSDTRCPLLTYGIPLPVYGYDLENVDFFNPSKSPTPRNQRAQVNMAPNSQNTSKHTPGPNCSGIVVPYVPTHTMIHVPVLRFGVLPAHSRASSTMGTCASTESGRTATRLHRVAVGGGEISRAARAHFLPEGAHPERSLLVNSEYSARGAAVLAGRMGPRIPVLTGVWGSELQVQTFCEKETLFKHSEPGGQDTAKSNRTTAIPVQRVPGRGFLHLISPCRSNAVLKEKMPAEINCD